MSYTKVLLLGIGLLLISVLLFAFNFNSTTTLGAIGRVIGGLMIFPGVILLFDGVAKGLTLYIFSEKNGVDHITFWHIESASKLNRR